MKKFILLLAICSKVISCFAQLSFGGLPLSFTNESIPTPLTIKMEAFDVESMLREDEKLNNKIGPFRFGKNFETTISLTNAGSWHELKDGRVWILAIESKGAYSLNLTFSEFFIPEGGKFFIYSDDKEKVIGSFTSQNNHPDRIFGTELVKGEKINLEYYEPYAVKNQSSLTISTVTHAYRDLLNTNSRNFGGSGNCNININCPDGKNWKEQARSVVMLLSGGNGFCTGTLINNTAENGKPYLLTANHCGSSGFGAWVFMFQFEAQECINPPSSPYSGSLTGAALKASNPASDFMLLELNNQVPFDYNPYYAGWNRSTSAASSTTTIHHPNGDIKKISLSNQQVVSEQWGGSDTWRVPGWSYGTTEPGSSGSPLFNPDKKIIGQLFGGSAACGNSLEDYYGKFSTSWNGSSANTRLKDWLDPLNTNVLELDGHDPGFSNLSDDAGIGSIIIPKLSVGYSCRASIKPIVTIKNYGTNNLTSANVSFQIGSEPAQLYPWSGNLSPGDVAEVTLPQINLPVGMALFTVKTLNPNGLTTDPNSYNDKKTRNIYNEKATDVRKVSPAYKEDFEGAVFPPKGWEKQNPDNTITWEKTNSASGFGVGNSSVFLNNYNYTAKGQRDYLSTPYLDFQNLISPASLEFDIAYARYNNQLFDSLIIAVSPDCGGEWQRVFEKGNWILSTNGHVNVQNSAFVPSETQWRRESIDLSAYIGQPHLRIRFENYSGNGNQLYIDNIQVQDGSVGIEKKTMDTAFLLYPNPASNQLNIHWQGDLVGIKIYSLIGSIVLSKTPIYQGNYQIDISALPVGIYTVEATTTSSTFKQKFIINK